MNEEEILRKINIYSTKKLIEIVEDPNATDKILIAAANACTDDTILTKILARPNLTSNVLSEVYTVNKKIGNNSIKIQIIQSNSLTQDLFDKIASDSQASPIKVKTAIIDSPFANESTCINMLNYYSSEYLTSGKTETIDLVMNSRHMSSNVLLEIVKIADTDEIMKKCLDSSHLTSTIFRKIIDKIMSDRSNYKTSYYKLLSNQFMDSTALTYLITTYPIVINKSGTEIITLPVITKDILLLILDNQYTKQDLIRKIVNHKDSTTEVLNKATIKLEALSKSAYAPDIKDDLIEIIRNKNCTEEVIARILTINSSKEVIEEIKKQPYLSVNLRYILASLDIQKKPSLNMSDFDEIFSIDGLEDKHYSALIRSNRKKELVIYRILEKDNISNEILKELIPEVIELSTRTITLKDGKTKEIDFIKEFLKKDIPEPILCILAKNVNNYSDIRKISEHPNAGLKIAAVFNIVAESGSYTTREKNKIINLAQEVKKRELSKKFIIETEEDVTEMLQKNVDAHIPTMLWGKSGVGKSSRVFEIDPTATMLILKNGILPEEVVGGREPNGNPGEVYPPHWYEVLKKKCESEPNRNHILFIDELTNVSDTVKSLIWEIVGNRRVNGREEWTLPENCSIIGAGNRPEESTAVRIDSNGCVIPEPLHNRFLSHITISFDLNEWQKWALETDPETKKLRIHPIVYSFCVANAEKVMFTNFDTKDVTKPFLTPRTWEGLSKALYEVEKRGEMYHISYKRLESIIGTNPTITNAFIDHYERLPIDMKAVEDGSYTPDDFISIEDKRYALGMLIAKYHGDEMAAELFISECLGEEYVSVYKAMKSLNKTVLEYNENEQGRKI